MTDLFFTWLALYTATHEKDTRAPFDAKMRALLAVVLLSYVAFVNGYIVRPFPKAEPTGRGQEMMVKLRMPGAVPTKKGHVMCTMFSLEDVGEINMIQWTVIGSSKIAHHLNVYGTEETFTPSENEAEDPWKCPGFEAIFVWCKNSPPTRLPPSMGFKVGGKHRTKTLILQVHYDHALSPEEADYSGHDIIFTREDQKYAAGFLLLNMNAGHIFPNQPKAHVDRCCQVDEKFHIFSFFTHAHGMGRLLTGYKIKQNTNTFEEIGRGNPQWPQIFFPLREVMDVEPGDTIALRCVFDSTTTNASTYVGSEGPADGTPALNPPEMCNFDILYYTDPVAEGEPIPTSWILCQDEPCAPDLVFPDDASDFLPPNPKLDMHAKFGNQSGIVKINEKYSVNLDLQKLSRNVKRGELEHC